MRAYILHVNGTVQPMPPLPPETTRYSASELQLAVGGYAIRIPTAARAVSRGRVDLVAFVSQSALSEGLPENPLGTLLLGTCAEKVYGPVVICPTEMV